MLTADRPDPIGPAGGGEEGAAGALGVEAEAPPGGQVVSVNGGVEEAREGVAVHQGVDLELGLFVHQVAGLRQVLVDPLPHPRVQTHLSTQSTITFTVTSTRTLTQLLAQR